MQRCCASGIRTEVDGVSIWLTDDLALDQASMRGEFVCSMVVCYTSAH